MFDALQMFSTTHCGTALPVLGGPHGALIGRLTEHEVLDYLRRTRDG